MCSKDLSSKISKARSVSHNNLPELDYNNLKQLTDKRADSEKSFLTYVDANGSRQRLSYKSFIQFVNKTACFLQEKGLSKGDRIATVSHNHWHTVVHYFAAWKLGLVVVPVNLGEDDERIAYILKQSEVKLAFIRYDYKERIEEILDADGDLKNIKTVICGDSTDTFTSDKEPEVDESPTPEAEDEALIVFTSGTTGPPKAVVLTQRNLLEDARAIADWHNIDASTRMMCVLPIHHVNGTVVTLLTPFFAGGSTVLNQKFQVHNFFPVIEKEQVHIVSVVPTLLQYLNSHYEEKEPTVPTQFRHVICGAGPLTIHVARDFEERFGVPIIHGYGLSETTCYSCFLPVDQEKSEHKKWMREHGYPSIGVPVPANEMAIHDENGNELDEQEHGEIVVRGVNVMKGYYNNPTANEKAFKHGWFRTGDKGFFIRDEFGDPYFFITGRLKELIIRGGVNLAPLEIDEVINKAPGVKAGIAVGFENDWYGEEVGAFVTPLEGAELNKEEILKYCRHHLPFSKSPKVVVVGDEIPVTSTGKYQRNKVAHHFEAWKTKQFRR